MKRNMTVAKGFLDISLLTANANQLMNAINYGNSKSTMHHLIIAGIIISIILQITAGIVMLVSERFDINKEEDQHHGDLLNTVVGCLIFTVLIINVFVAGLGVDIQPKKPHPGHSFPQHPPKDVFHTTTPSFKDIFKINEG